MVASLGWRCAVRTTVVLACTLKGAHEPHVQRGTVLFACMPRHAHEPYTREDDAFLWSKKSDDLAEVAAALGRGEKSCAARLERLRNPKSAGYLRLFGPEDPEEGASFARLRPARECIQRILYDPALSPADFRIGYRDRFRSSPVETPFDAPNDRVRGGARALVHALPEHRIEYIKYKRRLVWHKEQRRDDIFGSRGGLRVQEAVSSYASWEARRREQTRRARSRALSALGGGDDAEVVLGKFKRLLSRVKSGGLDVEAFVDAALSPALFGEDGNGIGAPAAPAAVVELIATLPDEMMPLRETISCELVERIRSA
jgi:uncharacterized protein (UPF0248 family)